MTPPEDRLRRYPVGWTILSIVSIGLAVPAFSGAASGSEPAPAAPAPTATVAPGKPLSREAGRAQAEPVAPPEGGSLGDIVRKSKEDRDGPETKRKKRSLGTITNENLKKDGTKATGDASAGKKGKGTLSILPKGSMPAPTPGVAGSLVIRDWKGRTEEDWRAILTKNRTDLEKAEADVKRLDLETKRLENDFYAWSDGNYRERVIRPSWDQARENLAKARTAVDAAQTSRLELEEEARKSGTPPGWLRDQ